MHMKDWLLYTGREQLDEAIAEFKQILELTSEPHKYYQDIGGLYLKKGEFDEALKYYQRYADQFPNESHSFRKLGELYGKMGNYKYQQAKSHYEKALLIEPGNTSVLLDLGDIEKKLGNFKQARLQYERALAESKSPEDQEKARSRLEYLSRVERANE